MNILAVFIGVESFYLAGLTIPLAVGCICGLIAVRHKTFDSMVNVVAIVLAPILAVAGMFMFAVLVDMVDAPHHDSIYFPMLIQSVARALLSVLHFIAGLLANERRLRAATRSLRLTRLVGRIVTL